MSSVNICESGSEKPRDSWDNISSYFHIQSTMTFKEQITTYTSALVKSSLVARFVKQKITIITYNFYSLMIFLHDQTINLQKFAIIKGV